MIPMRTLKLFLLSLILGSLAVGVFNACKETAQPAVEARSTPSRLFAIGGAPPAVPPICQTVSDGSTSSTASGCPASWSQAAWFIDPSNASTCASDSNATCGQSTCTAGPPGTKDGPCLSYAQIASRWGTYAPRLMQSTTLTWISSQSATLFDPVYFTPYIEGLSQVTLQGSLVAAGTATLGTVTAKVISTSGNLLQSTLTGVTGTAGVVGQFVIDTTHASRAWVYGAGPPVVFSQPVTTFAPGGSPGSEVNWTNGGNSGDAVTFYSPPAADIVVFMPILVNAVSTAAKNNAFIFNLTGLGTGAQHLDPTLLNAWVSVSESRLSNLVEFTNPLVAHPQDYLYNSFWDDGLQMSTTVSTSPSISMLAGVFGLPGGTIRNFVVSSAFVAFDPIINVATPILNATNFQSTYLETGSTVNVDGFLSIGNTVWGPGAVNVQQIGRLAYPSGASAAVANLLWQGGIQANGQTKVCSSPPVDAAAPACNLTLSATQLDTSLGAVSGCLYVPGGGSYCNVN